jgi:hypothetical protein
LVSLTALPLSHSNVICLNLIPKSPKVVVPNNYRPKCTQLWLLNVQHYFASSVTKTQVIFLILTRARCALSIHLAYRIIGVRISN